MTLRVVVEADGGSRGNPGPAGYGAVVRDASSGAVLAERADGLGAATNNVAEYQGLIAGLRAAAELGAAEVEARLDSKLVVEQMSGRWKIKHPQLEPLAREAAGLVRQLGRVRFVWVPRAQNAYADRLANEAMDAQAGVARPVRPAVPTSRAAASWTGQVGTPTRLLLLRHGQTALSGERRYSGRGEVELTGTGTAQAQAAAARLSTVPDVAGVVCSPLRRARQTAQPVADALGLPLDVADGLTETDFGAWEGLTFAAARDRDPELHGRWLGDETVAPPGGESFAVVHRRVRRTRDELIRRYGGATVVVVSHVTPIKTLLRLALDVGPSLLFRLHLDLASLSMAEFYPDGGGSVRLVNDTNHLR